MTVLWLAALVDALRVPDPVWARAGQGKLLWVLVVVLAGVIGALLYAVMARPALGRVQSS
ncbi:MAG TPA: PLDc N-terminal domain-containing protein [Frateuria sp.]|uniref:PLDc N-terminal domain-containing protein n=1 Tax=Frateuria sp. TaxID=2211372 RepID=UPI002D7E21AB|nr:PLDc N-terminal domain-containing protein [Frateuria sp.]HET6804135.1 PLDc N-terminal domain-containing protein [Frateuria sp.]